MTYRIVCLDVHDPKVREVMQSMRKVLNGEPLLEQDIVVSKR